MRRVTVWCLLAILTMATPARAVVLFSVGFETYADSNSPLYPNTPVPNAAPNRGPRNPVVGPPPPNLRGDSPAA